MSGIVTRRQIGDRIPGRIARVLRVHLEKRDGRRFVVYVLSDSLRGRNGSGRREGPRLDGEARPTARRLVR
jgi:hypothetical protein